MKGGVTISLILVVAIVILAVVLKQTNVGQLIFEDALTRTRFGTLCLQFPDGSLKKFGENVAHVGTGLDKTPCDNTMMIIKPKEFFDKLAFVGFKVGMGEAYMEGLWDAAPNTHLHDLYSQLMWNAFQYPPWYAHILEMLCPANIYLWFERRFLLTHTKEQEMEVVTPHYNAGNDFYSWFLDDSMMYTCAIWGPNITTLRQAQDNKLDIIFRKLKAQKGHRVLDFGSGWGYAASKLTNLTGAQVTAITLTSSQVEYSKDMFENPCVKAGNKNCPRYHQMDYRDVSRLGPFDRIYAIGSIEHVEMRNLDTFMTILSDNLVEEGLIVFHYGHEYDMHPQFIPSDRAHACSNAAFVHKYIFPGGCLISPDWIAEVAMKHGLYELHRESFGLSYVRTLRNWGNNLIAHKKDVLEKYDETFYRMFRAYLAEAEGVFRARAVVITQQIYIKEPKHAPLAGKKLDLDFWNKHYVHYGY